MTRSATRQGAVLIVVVGISVTLLTMMVAFLARMQQSADSTNPIIQETQSRIMLHAAMMYIQESSRLGWGTPVDKDGKQVSAHSASCVGHTETYGWTDIRTGALGPTGARFQEAEIPAPVWMDSSQQGGYRAMRGFLGDRVFPKQWPYPGSTVIVNSAVWKLPPYATRLQATYNPIHYNKVVGPQNEIPTQPNDENLLFVARNVVQGKWGGSETEMAGVIDPQPVKKTWGEFAAGDKTIRDGTDNRAWFRIYREMLRDHDGLPDGTGDETADLVCLNERVSNGTHRNKNWNVFVITCGTGPTRGYRNWDEVVSLGAQSYFGNKSVFEQLRRREALMWWRVEWSAQQGGGFDPGVHQGGFGMDLEKMRRSGNRTYGGNFSMVQRLIREPEEW